MGLEELLKKTAKKVEAAGFTGTEKITKVPKTPENPGGWVVVPAFGTEAPGGGEVFSSGSTLPPGTWYLVPGSENLYYNAANPEEKFQLVAAPKPPPAYTTVPQLAFHTNQAQMYLEYILGEGTVGASEMNMWINVYAERFHTETGRWPTAEDMANDPSFEIGALGLIANLPTQFMFGGQMYSTVGTEGYAEFPYGVGNPAPEGYTGPDPSTPVGAKAYEEWLKVPKLTPSLLSSIIESYRTTMGIQPRGGGGSRGPVVDKEYIKEQVTTAYRYYLLDEPPDPGAMAEKFIAEYVAFARQGGQLDLTTWMKNQIRQTPRYKLLYARKPKEVDEDDYVNTYRGVAAQSGLAQSYQTGFIEQGMSSGNSVAGFAEQIEGSRPYMVSNNNFGRKVANAISMAGVLNR